MIIGIDPSQAKGQAYAIWNDTRIVECGKFHTIHKWVQIITTYKPEFTYIEDQFLGRNYNSVKKLTLQVGKMVGFLEYKNLQYKIINVATWQSRVGLLDYAIGEKSQKIRKKMRAEKSIDMANRFVNTDDDDVACAVLIAYSMRKDEIDDRIFKNFTKDLAGDRLDLAQRAYELLKFEPIKKKELLRMLGLESNIKSPNSLDVLSSILPIYQSKGGWIGLMNDSTLT